MKHSFFLRLILIYFLAITASGFSQVVVMYENLEVDQILIEWGSCFPEKGLDASVIKSRLSTKEKDLFSHLDFDADLKVLAKDFDRIEPSLKEVEGKLVITLKIWTKPKIRSIFWEGNEKVVTRRLQKELGIANQTIFERLDFNKALHKIRAYYIRKGFFESEIELRVDYDELTNEVDLTILIQEGRAGRIKKIQFLNFEPEEEAAIIDKMLTKEYNLFTSWFTKEGTYHDEVVQQDRMTLIHFLQNEGYADAKVDIAIGETDECDKIDLIIVADKGLRYFFKTISFEGNTLFCDAEIQELIRLKEGEPFSPDRIRAVSQRIMNAYGRKGYIDAIVQFEPKLCPKSQQYDIHFNILEGQQYRVGLIKVFGNCATKTKVILHETLLIPGEIFNSDKLQKTEERLQNIGYFKNVNVYAVKSEGPEGLGEHYRDVHIEVEETSTGNFSAFFGFSTAESVFGGLSLTEKNFNAEGLKTLFGGGLSHLRGGGEYLQLSWTIGARSRSYLISWTKPYFMDTQWTLGLDLERASNRYISDDYDIESTGFNLHAMYQINAFLRGGVHYRLKDARVVLDRKAKRKIKRDEILTGSEKISGMVSAIGASLIYDSSDHPQKPHSGFKSRIDVEYAGLLGHHHFISGAYLNSYYIPLGPQDVFKIRGDFRFIAPFEYTTVRTIPLDERFFLGGENALRGWRPYRLGPSFDHVKGSSGSIDDPKGGISLQVYSLEYSREFHPRLDAFAFFDAGYLSDQEWHMANFKMLRSSVGAGVRLKILDSAPPLTVGMGFPIHPENRSLVKKFFLTVGGKF